MLETLILLAIAALLGLYAVRELAPARWAADWSERRRKLIATTFLLCMPLLGVAGALYLTPRPLALHQAVRADVTYTLYGDLSEEVLGGNPGPLPHTYTLTVPTRGLASWRRCWSKMLLNGPLKFSLARERNACKMRRTSTPSS